MNNYKNLFELLSCFNFLYFLFVCLLKKENHVKNIWNIEILETRKIMTNNSGKIRQ